MSKTLRDNKEKQIHYPNYELDGVASTPKFFNKLKQLVSPPKGYKSKKKLWKD